jgi:hypothetical protein
MKNLLLLVISVMSLDATTQIIGKASKLDTIPSIQLEFQDRDSLVIIKYNIIDSFKIGEDSILIYKEEGSGVQLIRSQDGIIKTAKIGINQPEALGMNLHLNANELKYTAFIDSLDTSTPYIILNWLSQGISRSSLCFGDSGHTTNTTTTTQKGMTIIDIKNSIVMFKGLTSYSTSHTNYSDGNFGGSCSPVSLNLETNLLSLKQVKKHSTSQNDEIIDREIGRYDCPGSNSLYFYNYEINEDADYQLKNGLFVKMK